jgi:hypothetical protein
VDGHLGLDPGYLPVLVAELRPDPDAVGAVVEGVHQARVALSHQGPPDLAGAGELLVVGVEELVEEDEAAHPLALREGSVHGLDLGPDELGHLGLPGEVHVGRVGEAPALGPVADRGRVDVDEGGDVLPTVPVGHGLLDVR